MKKKFGSWWLRGIEGKVKRWLVPKLPKWLETQHLTMATVAEGIMCLAGGYLAREDLNWLWLMSAGVIGHYITDTLDGAVGRYRNTGLIKWGFYMDHLLDFYLFGCILAGYWFITPAEYKYVLFATLCVAGAYFAHTILHFGATGRYEIASFGIGPSEARVIFVVINTVLIFAGRLYLVAVLPWVFGALLIGVGVAVYRKQKQLWKEDMRIKRNEGI